MLLIQINTLGSSREKHKDILEKDLQNNTTNDKLQMTQLQQADKIPWILNYIELYWVCELKCVLLMDIHEENVQEYFFSWVETSWCKCPILELKYPCVKLSIDGHGTTSGNSIVCSPKIITKVIFIVLTFALGMSPRELVRLVSASSKAILCLRTSVSGTAIRNILNQSPIFNLINI